MIAQSEIEKLASALYEEILKAYKANPNITYTEILNDYLLKFNDDIAILINEEIGNIMNKTVGGITAIVTPLEGVVLSSVLYKNSEYVAKQVLKVINEHLLIQSTIAEISKALYDGYGYGHVLEIANSASLPKYIMQDLTEARILKLKTKSLTAAYFRVLDTKTDKQLEKALYVASQEKARYYALRIADVEEQKAFRLMTASEHIDDGVKYVKVTLSSSHKTVCICNYFASENIGFGPGVTRLRDAKLPPYHPWCRCRLVPVEVKRTWNISSPKDSALRNFTKSEVRRIESGLRSKWSRPTIGDVFS